MEHALARCRSSSRRSEKLLDLVHDLRPAVLAVDVRTTLLPELPSQIRSAQQIVQPSGELVVILIIQRPAGAQSLAFQDTAAAVDERGHAMIPRLEQHHAQT